MKRYIRSNTYYGVDSINYKTNIDVPTIEYRGYVFNEREFEKMVRDGEYGHYDPDRDFEFSIYMQNNITKDLDGYIRAYASKHNDPLDVVIEFAD